MKTISQADLKSLEAAGSTVNRRGMPKKKDAPKAVEKAPKKETAPAPVAKGPDVQADATRQVVAYNSAVMDSFRKDLIEAMSKGQKKVPYIFDVERSKDRLITRIIATPQNDDGGSK